MQRIDLLPHIGEIGRAARRARLDEHPADKINTVVEPERQEAADRYDGEQNRECESGDMPAHEVDVRGLVEKNQRAHGDRDLKSSGLERDGFGTEAMQPR